MNIIRTKQQAKALRQMILDDIIALSPGSDDEEIQQLYRWNVGLKLWIENDITPESNEVKFWLEGNTRCLIEQEYGERLRQAENRPN